jgi:hypothetical protein
MLPINAGIIGWWGCGLQVAEQAAALTDAQGQLERLRAETRHRGDSRLVDELRNTTKAALKEAARYRGKFEETHEQLHALRGAVSVSPQHTSPPLPCRPSRY